MVKDTRASTSTDRLRRLNEPQPVMVETTADGDPVSVLWRGRLPGRHVVEVDQRMPRRTAVAA